MTNSSVLTDDAVDAFAAFADHLNFTRAAETLHIAQPSLHAKIAKLSKSLDVKLYEKVGRDLQLTTEGHELAQFARDARRRADDLLSSFSAEPTVVELTAGRGMLQWVLGEHLKAAIRGGTTMKVFEANRETAIQRLKMGAADVIGVASEPPPSDLAQAEIARFPQVALIPTKHPLSSKGAVSLTDLVDEPLLLSPRGRPHRQQIDQAFAACGETADVVSEVDGWPLMMHLASLGVGLTIVNGCVPAPRAMVAVPVADLPEVGYWVAWRAQRPQGAQLFLRRKV